jgi:hypothetical protein
LKTIFERDVVKTEREADEEGSKGQGQGFIVPLHIDAISKHAVPAFSATSHSIHVSKQSFFPMADSANKGKKRAEAHSEDRHAHGCILQQFTMFDCDQAEFEQKGNVKCYPIPRVFRM